MITQIHSRIHIYTLMKSKLPLHPLTLNKYSLEEVKTIYDKWSFQPTLGSHLKQTKPDLEFIKFICEVFSIEPLLESSVTVMKRQCLRKLRMTEYDKGAPFEEPSLELIVPQLTCDKCQVSCNLDICQEYNFEISGWVCKDCKDLYNPAIIEKKLIEVLNNRVISHQIQDVECTKCEMIKDKILGHYCSCTGRYKNTQGDIPLKKLQNKNLLNTHSEVKVLIKLLKNIARIQKFKMLYRISDMKMRLVC